MGAMIDQWYRKSDINSSTNLMREVVSYMEIIILDWP